MKSWASGVGVAGWAGLTAMTGCQALETPVASKSVASTAMQFTGRYDAVAYLKREGPDTKDSPHSLVGSCVVIANDDGSTAIDTTTAGTIYSCWTTLSAFGETPDFTTQSLQQMLVGFTSLNATEKAIYPVIRVALHPFAFSEYPGTSPHENRLVMVSFLVPASENFSVRPAKKGPRPSTDNAASSTKFVGYTSKNGDYVRVGGKPDTFNQGFLGGGVFTDRDTSPTSCEPTATDSNQPEVFGLIEREDLSQFPREWNAKKIVVIYLSNQVAFMKSALTQNKRFSLDTTAPSGLFSASFLHPYGPFLENLDKSLLAMTERQVSATRKKNAPSANGVLLLEEHISRETLLPILNVFFSKETVETPADNSNAFVSRSEAIDTLLLFIKKCRPGIGDNRNNIYVNLRKRASTSWYTINSEAELNSPTTLGELLAYVYRALLVCTTKSLPEHLSSEELHRYEDPSKPVLPFPSADSTQN